MDETHQQLAQASRLYGQSTQTCPSFKHAEKVFDFVFTGIVHAGHLNKNTDTIGSLTYKHWRKMLSDMTDDNLQSGYDNLPDFNGFLTVGKFKELCRDSSAIAAAQARQAIEPPNKQSLLNSSSLGDKRFAKFHKMITLEMMKEPGEGPITKATKDGFFTKSLISNNEPERVLELCREKYGATASAPDTTLPTT